MTVRPLLCRETLTSKNNKTSDNNNPDIPGAINLSSVRLLLFSTSVGYRSRQTHTPDIISIGKVNCVLVLVTIRASFART